MNAASPSKPYRLLILLLLVAAGGAFGAGLRSVVEASMAAFGGPPTAWLLVVNLSGSFILGIAFARLDPRAAKIVGSTDVEVPETELPGARAHHPILSAFLAVGFCGALTTWSSLAERVAWLLHHGHGWEAVVLLVVLMVAGVGMVGLGARLGRRDS